MSLTSLTKREQEWRSRARLAIERGEEWEKCDECWRYHPVDYEGDCADDDYRLPSRPQDVIE